MIDQANQFAIAFKMYSSTNFLFAFSNVNVHMREKMRVFDPAMPVNQSLFNLTWFLFKCKLFSFCKNFFSFIWSWKKISLKSRSWLIVFHRPCFLGSLSIECSVYLTRILVIIYKNSPSKLDTFLREFLILLFTA